MVTLDASRWSPLRRKLYEIAGCQLMGSSGRRSSCSGLVGGPGHSQTVLLSLKKLPARVSPKADSEHAFALLRIRVVASLRTGPT
jgi:hypothetical protein